MVFVINDDAVPANKLVAVETVELHLFLVFGADHGCFLNRKVFVNILFQVIKHDYTVASIELYTAVNFSAIFADEFSTVTTKCTSFEDGLEHISQPKSHPCFAFIMTEYTSLVRFMKRRLEGYSGHSQGQWSPFDTLGTG